MGLMGDILGTVFGGGRNVLRETVEVFRPNAEADAMREATRHAAALGQFAAEFAQPKRGVFDRFIDGLNRLPRPALALGTLGLFASALIDPTWFVARMQGVAVIPEPLWWLMGAIVSFYFGARHQAKTHDLQRSLALSLAQLPNALSNIETLTADRPVKDASQHAVPLSVAPAEAFPNNAALRDWRAGLEW